MRQTRSNKKDERKDKKEDRKEARAEKKEDRKEKRQEKKNTKSKSKNSNSGSSVYAAAKSRKDSADKNKAKPKQVQDNDKDNKNKVKAKKPKTTLAASRKKGISAAKKKHPEEFPEEELTASPDTPVEEGEAGSATGPEFGPEEAPAGDESQVWGHLTGVGEPGEAGAGMEGPEEPPEAAAREGGTSDERFEKWKSGWLGRAAGGAASAIVDPFGMTGQGKIGREGYDTTPRFLNEGPQDGVSAADALKAGAAGVMVGGGSSGAKLFQDISKIRHQPAPETGIAKRGPGGMTAPEGSGGPAKSPPPKPGGPHYTRPPGSATGPARIPPGPVGTQLPATQGPSGVATTGGPTPTPTVPGPTSVATRPIPSGGAAPPGGPHTTPIRGTSLVPRATGALATTGGEAAAGAMGGMASTALAAALIFGAPASAYYQGKRQVGSTLGMVEQAAKHHDRPITAELIPAAFIKDLAFEPDTLERAYDEGLIHESLYQTIIDGMGN